MVTRFAPLALALLCAASLASAFPIMSGNSYNKARKGIVFDTLYAPLNVTRSVYFIDCPQGTVRSNMDSLVQLWKNGGAAPRLRRMQHLILWEAGAGSDIVFDLTIFRDNATSVNRGIYMPSDRWIDLPIEADSLQFKIRSTSNLAIIGMAYW